MGFITREVTAPIEDGDDLSGSEIEAELTKIFNEIDGGLDTTNLAAAAGLLGTQIADDTIPAAKIASSTITTTQMAASAVPKHGISTYNNTGDLTTSSTLVDVPNVSVTLTPGSTSDIVLMSLAVTIEQDTAGTSPEYQWGFNIADGTTGDVLVASSELRGGGTTQNGTFVFQHVMTALTTSSTVYTPRYKIISSASFPCVWSSTVGLDYTTAFRVLIIPIK